MEELEKTQSPYFNDGLHLQFTTDAENFFAKLDTQKFNIAPQLDIFHLELVQEGECYKIVRKSDFSELKEALDGERDTTVLGVRDAIRMSLRHFKPEIKEAAKRVNIVYDTYNRPVPITKQSYDIETASIDSFLADLNRDYIVDIEILGLSEWVAELSRLNAKFRELTEATNKQKAQKANLHMAQARKKVDLALKNIIKLIEADMIRNPEINYDEFITEWNTLVKHYNDIWAQHLGRIKAKKEKKKQEEKENKENEENEENGDGER
jgi:hypothetical protein